MSPRDDAVVAVAWYRRDQWARLRELAADGDRLEASYEDWLANARRTLVGASIAGVPARRVDVDVEALARWCREEGRPLDAGARAEFAARVLRGTDPGARPRG